MLYETISSREFLCCALPVCLCVCQRAGGTWKIFFTVLCSSCHFCTTTTTRRRELFTMFHEEDFCASNKNNTSSTATRTPRRQQPCKTGTTPDEQHSPRVTAERRNPQTADDHATDSAIQNLRRCPSHSGSAVLSAEPLWEGHLRGRNVKRRGT